MGSINMVHNDIRTTITESTDKIFNQYSEGLISFAEYMQSLHDITGYFLAEQHEHDQILEGKIHKVFHLDFLDNDIAITSVVHAALFRLQPNMHYTKIEIADAIERLIEDKT